MLNIKQSSLIHYNNSIFYVNVGIYVEYYRLKQLGHLSKVCLKSYLLTSFYINNFTVLYKCKNRLSV